MAIKNDEELSKLLQNATISEGGVLPNIHPVLLPRKTKQTEKEAKEWVNLILISVFYVYNLISLYIYCLFVISRANNIAFIMFILKVFF